MLLGKGMRRYVFILGVILVLVGIATSAGLASLTIVKQPFDIRVTPNTRATWQWTGDMLTIDLSRVTPTGTSYYNGPTTYSVEIIDTKPRTSGNVVYQGFIYTVRIYSGGKVEILASNEPFLMGDMRGINEPDQILVGNIVVWRGDLSVEKIAFDMKNHQIIVGDKNIPMLPSFSCSRVSVMGVVNPPPFTGYIHLYGGYMLKQVTENRAETRTTTTREPAQPVTTTTIPEETPTQTPTITHEPVPITTTINGETHVIVAQPIGGEEETATGNNYGTWMMVAGTVLIIIALL